MREALDMAADGWLMHWQSCRFIWTKVAKLEFGNFIKTIILIFFYTFNILPYSKTFQLKGTLTLKLQKLSHKDIIDIKGSFIKKKNQRKRWERLIQWFKINEFLQSVQESCGKVTLTVKKGRNLLLNHVFTIFHGHGVEYFYKFLFCLLYTPINLGRLVFSEAKSWQIKCPGSSVQNKPYMILQN